MNQKPPFFGAAAVLQYSSKVLLLVLVVAGVFVIGNADAALFDDNAAAYGVRGGGGRGKHQHGTQKRRGLSAYDDYVEAISNNSSDFSVVTSEGIEGFVVDDPDFVNDIDDEPLPVEELMLLGMDDPVIIEEEKEVDEEAAQMDVLMEAVYTDNEEDDSDYEGRRHLLEKGPNGCTVVKTLGDIATLNGQTATLCSFEINSENKGCNTGVRGYSVTKKTSLTCEEGGTCHINCPTGHFYVENKSELSLIGNFVLEGSQQSAINFHSGTLNMVGATIKNNSHKPAIFLFYRAIAIICDCTFEGNGAGITSNGGAIALHHHHARLQISGSVFRNNRAKDKGGAIYALGQPSHDQAAFAEITGSTFEGNQARYGDHIYSEPHPNHANGFKTDACQEGGTTFSGSRTCNGIARGHTGGYCMAAENACMVPAGADAYVMGLDLWELRPEGVCASSYKDLPPAPCVPIKKMSDFPKLTGLPRDLSVTLCPFHMSKQGGCDSRGYHEEHRINSGTARWYHKPRKTSLTCEEGGSCVVDCVQRIFIAGGCHNFGCTFDLIGNFVFTGATDGAAGLGSGTHTFKGLTFKKNSGKHGAGAITMGEGHLNLCDCTFEDNKGIGGAGGALRAVHGLTTTWMISGCTFRRNSNPEGSGGAIITGSRDPNKAPLFAIKDSIFEDNSARDKGDHIFSYQGRESWNGFKTDICTGGTTFSGSKTCNGIERSEDGCMPTDQCNVPYDYVHNQSRKQTPVSQFPRFVKFDASFSNGECPAPPTVPPTPSPTKSPTPLPTPSPTAAPTVSPTPGPTTDTPSVSPTASPTVMSGHPSSSPTTSPPTHLPTPLPTPSPTQTPTPLPTSPPTPSPTQTPTPQPTPAPTRPSGWCTDSSQCQQVACMALNCPYFICEDNRCVAGPSRTCPVEKPADGDRCAWEGQNCYYGEVTCCKKTYNSYTAECHGGIVRAYYNDICDNPICDPSSFGDPHFRTWSGHQYDFHGGCDLVLVKHPHFEAGLGLNIHIRTQIKTWWSYIEAAALQIGNDILEVQGGANSQVWLNGEKLAYPNAESSGYAQLGGFPVKMKAGRMRKHEHTAHIDLSKGESITIRSFGDFVRVTIKHKTGQQIMKSRFWGTLGLLGNFPNGNMTLRDGVAQMEDPNEFGQHWMVRSDTDHFLFHDAFDAPDAPSRCPMPEEATRSVHRLLAEGDITMEDAKEACGTVPIEDIDYCVHDVIATQSIDVAGSYGGGADGMDLDDSEEEGMAAATQEEDKKASEVVL